MESSSSNTEKARVLLINMPWGSITEPALGISVLKASLDRCNVASKILNLNLLLLRFLKFKTYVNVADLYAVNDFVFSSVLDRSGLSRERFSALLEVAARLHKEVDDQLEITEKILRIRQLVVEPYLEDCVSKILHEDPTLVGFTCSFDQTMASLACAKLLRKKKRNVFIVLGGYAVNGEVGKMLLECFPFIDCVAQGDSETTIVKLAEVSSGKLELSEVPGIQYRNPLGHVVENINVPSDLDNVPIPNFDDYFLDKRELKIEHGIKIHTEYLPVETSRGCWWGQKSHCIFCGIDDETMRYRARSVDSVVEMMDVLYAKYKVSNIRFTDYILPHSYHSTLVLKLIESPKPYRISCEMKANISKDRLENLKRAGFSEVQPGIESFSSEVLSLMRKGVSGVQNVFLLVMGKRLDLSIHYNIVYGFPGESAEDYKHMSKLLPMLYHLDPPISVTRALYTRYSPLQMGEVDESPGSTIPDDPYRIIFDEEYSKAIGFDMSRYCYYFESGHEQSTELSYWNSIIDIQCNHWKKLQTERPIVLEFYEQKDGVSFYDSRTHSEGRIFEGDDDLLRVYKRIFESPTTEETLIEVFGKEVGKRKVLKCLRSLELHRLTMTIDNKIVGLALPVSDHA